MNRIKKITMGTLIGAALFFCAPLFAGKLLSELSDAERSKQRFFTATVERYDIAWEIPGPQRTEAIFIDDVVQFLNTHDQALMKSDPERYLPLLNRFLNPENFHKFMVDYKLGRLIMGRLSSVDNSSLVEKLNQGKDLEETEYSDNAIDFGVRFLLGVPPMWIPGGDADTHNQNFAALNFCFGSRVLQKLQDLEQLPMGNARVKAFLGDKLNLWQTHIRALPLIHLPQQTAHYDLHQEAFEVFFDEKTTLRNFMQNVAFYRYHFDFKNRTKATEIAQEFLPINLPAENGEGGTRFWEPQDFARLQAQIELMFDGAYNPHAPLYTLDEVHNIWRQIAENILLQKCESGEEYINTLKNGELAKLRRELSEDARNNLALCNLNMSTKNILGQPNIPTELDIIKGQSYGWFSIISQIKLQAIQRLYNSYLLLRMDENNTVGRHMLQGTLDTANFLMLLSTGYITLWHSKLPAPTPGIHAQQ